jgi:hypothetical protein
MDGIGMVIKGKSVKYGLWKKGERKQRFKVLGNLKYIIKKELVCLKINFVLMIVPQIVKLI